MYFEEPKHGPVSSALLNSCFWIVKFKRAWSESQRQNRWKIKSTVNLTHVVTMPNNKKAERREKRFVRKCGTVGRHLWEMSSTTGRVWRQWERYRTLRHKSSVRSNDRIKVACWIYAYLMSSVFSRDGKSKKNECEKEQQKKKTKKRKLALHARNIHFNHLLIQCIFQRNNSLVRWENPHSAIFYINNQIAFDTCNALSRWKRNTLTRANYVYTHLHVYMYPWINERE